VLLSGYFRNPFDNCSCIARGACFWCSATSMAQAGLSTASRSHLLHVGVPFARSTCYIRSGMITTMTAQTPAPVARQPTLLQLDRLQRPAIGPVSLDVAAGECVCISGPSGAGKSQLLRAIADLDPHDGEVRLSGHAAGGIAPPEWRRQVGLLPPESSWLLPCVSDHFHAGASLPLAEVGLDDAILDQPVARLSSGEKQRLALLRLLANQPLVLLLDEPTANLDPENTRRVEAVIATYRESRDAAVIWISHDREQAARVCDRHYAVVDGALQQQATASQA
jgi:ABC-type iron transport system FetAB ATPase subunit